MSLARGKDTVLGSTADPREFFLTMDCEDIALSTVSKVLGAQYKFPNPGDEACRALLRPGATSAAAAGGGGGGVEEEGRHRGSHRRAQGGWR